MCNFIYIAILIIIIIISGINYILISIGQKCLEFQFLRDKITLPLPNCKKSSVTNQKFVTRACVHFEYRTIYFVNEISIKFEFRVTSFP